MAYEIGRLPEEEIFYSFENVLLGFKLKRDEDTEENQIAIKVHVYDAKSKAPTRPDKKRKPNVTCERRVDYADVLEEYNYGSGDFNLSFIKSVLNVLKSELVPVSHKSYKYSLKEEIKGIISEGLRRYIPKNEKSIGGGVGTG